MSSKTLDFKCAVITGGGGGIGKAMAQWLISHGKKVIIVGRTEKKLQETAQELGNDTTYYVLDTGNIQAIPKFIETVTKEHPDVDCLINNAGVQRPLDVNDFDLSKANDEIAININGPMHLAVGFLPHFKTKPTATIMNVTSVLGYSPFMILNPIYNGTKAFTHCWTMNFRTQLQASPSLQHVKVVEIVPPTVATDLHRERSDPDDNKKEKNPNAMSLEEFMKEVGSGWEADDEVIAPGAANASMKKWYDAFGEEYEEAAEGYKKK